MLPHCTASRPRTWLRRPVLLVAVAGAAVVLLSLAALSTRRTYTLTMAWAEAEPAPVLSGPQPDYVVFSPSSSIPPQAPPRIPALPEWCIDAHFALGHTCAPGYYGNELPKGTEKFDLVWTWVNSSDARLREAMDEARREEGLTVEEEPSQDKLYRDHDELRHSFRSVLQHFRAHANSFTLFTSDFPGSDADAQSLFDVYADRDEEDADEFDAEEQRTGRRRRTVEPVDDGAPLRLGLRPSWLTPDARGWRDGDVELGLQFQSEVFEQYEGTSFNSYSIESQLHRLQFPSDNDVFIYLNDDFFMLADLAPADFHTAAMGPVLRLDAGFLVPPAPIPTLITPAGEWGPLFASNALLSARFGARGRPYTQHVPKALSRALLGEAHAMWGAALVRTAGHRFRGMGLEGVLGDGEGGEGDAYGVFLTMHLGVERWREALLWAFVVGRVGGAGDAWGELERVRAWAALGGDEREEAVRVRLTWRRSTDEGRVKGVLRKAGYAWSDRTRYAFSSEDGYPYTFPAVAQTEAGWPAFSGKALGRELCVLPAGCFVGRSASEVFKRVAFDEPTACGDCIIHALRTQSGEYGLSAFLPDTARTVVGAPRAPDGVVGPHLPLHRDGDFSFEGVVGAGAVNVRQWTLRLLERYRFVIGDSGTALLMIQKPQDAKSALFSWINSDWWISLVCVNDDILEAPAETDALIREWEGGRWGARAAWER